MDDAEKLAYEHSWNMFDKHATQRMQSINFFLGVLGGVSAAAFAFSDKYSGWVLIIIGIFTMLITFVFRLLEDRNKKLVKISEESLKKFEEILSIKSEIDVKFIVKADEESKKGGSSYAKAISKLFYIAYTMGLAMCLLGILTIFSH